MNIIKNKKLSFFINILLALSNIIIFDCFFRTINSITIKTSLRFIIIEIGIFALIYLILLGIVKKTNITNFIISIVFIIFSLFNQLKIYYTNNPIILSDLLYLNTATEIVDIVDNSLTSVILDMFSSFLPYIFFIIILKLTSNRCVISVENKYIRASIITIPIIIFFIIFIPNSNVHEFMIDKVYNLHHRKDYQHYTTNIKYVGKYGVISSLYLNYLESKPIKAKDYNIKEIEKIKDVIVDADDSFGKPNIIVLFAESFWDISQVDELKFNKPVTPNFNSLKEKGIFFNMISPSYGGLSANVEFEFLTGASMQYFSNGYVPYMQLYTNNSYYNRPSIISELKKENYITKVRILTSKNLFNCGRFYDYLKIDEVNDDKTDDKSKYVNKYVSDEYLVDQIIEEFNNKEKGKREFYMALSMESHMPYNKDKYTNYELSLEKNNFSEDFHDMILSYAEGIHNMDKQLARLYDYIQTLDEPTMLVFYGDHLPYLKVNSENALKILNYFNTEDKNLNTYRQYNTQSLILANFEIEEKEYNYLGPDLLGSYIVNRMDLNISPYYKWLYSNLDTLPASNVYVSVDKNGNIYSTDNLPNNMMKLYKFRNNVQYKYFID